MKKIKTNKKDKAEKQNLSEVDVIGTVLEARPNAMFDVELENGQRVLCTISGKIRVKHIHITPGDKCLIGVNIYDMSKGRIKFRYDTRVQQKETTTT